jgi:uncharacterized protein YjbI with pentapeptide repeats
MKLLKLLLPLLIIASQLAYGDTSRDFYKKRIKNTCQCPYCDLEHMDLKAFQPGSTQLQQNPFAKEPQKKAIMPWLTCNFSGAQLHKANLQQANFSVSIRGYVTPLLEANFTNADLTQVNLSHSQLYGVNFRYANLTGANLSHSVFFLNHFAYANLTRANLTAVTAKVDAMHGWGGDFKQANFTQANLSKAQLYGDFSHANFTGANLTHAKLVATTAASSQEADQPWRKANFTRANLKGAQLEHYGSKESDLQTVIFCHTVMPDGHISNRNCPK